MKQLHKGKQIDLNKAVKNIIKTYHLSDSFISNDWYKEAHQYAQFLATYFGVPLSVACGVIAALSPIKQWQENKNIAYGFFETGRVKHTKVFADKARQIKATDGQPEKIISILNGRKIISFFLNILNPENTTAITIDRHALSIILDRNATENDYRGMTAKQYAFFVLCYQTAGVKLKVSPVIVQAISWQNWREAKGIKEVEQDYVPF